MFTCLATLFGPRRSVLTGLLAALLMLCLHAGAAAQQTGQRELIQSFDSRLEVESSGDFLVTETIRVVATGIRIQRGIYRDFPIILRHANGLIKRYGFEVVSVSRDGKPEPWREERKEGNARVYIGDEDVLLEPGVYTYQLTYRSFHQLRKQEGFDEIYWNVTGDDWAFRIESASSTIVLPQGVPILQHSFYTGVRGEQGKQARVLPGSSNEFRVESTQTLMRGEGLTVAVAIPQNSIAGAEGPEDGEVADNFGLIAFGLSPLGVFAYLLWAWNKVGRDPPAGVVFPRFEPPDGLSPAAVSYLYHWGLRARVGGASRALIAALMSLAVKGRISLAKVGKRIEVSRNIQPVNAEAPMRASLPPGEQALHTGLLVSDSILLDKKNRSTVTKAVRSFEKALKTEYGAAYFRDNFLWLVPALLIGGAGLLMVFLTWVPSESQQVSAIFTLAASPASFLMVVQGCRMLTGDMPGHHPALAWLRIVFGASILIALSAVFVVSPWYLPKVAARFNIDAAASAMAAITMVLVGLCAMFYALLFAPTERGRQIADEIAGFRQYLAVAEGERMNMAGAPAFDTDLFERYLPYAIALGVEKPWAEALEKHLASTLAGSNSSYRPRYFSGTDFNTRDISKSTASFASSIGSSFASAMPSSSGSGGSGSSGGGGGGGGGGGW